MQGPLGMLFFPFVLTLRKAIGKNSQHQSVLSAGIRIRRGGKTIHRVKKGKRMKKPASHHRPAQIM
jgi:hypothetical protein